MKKRYYFLIASVALISIYAISQNETRSPEVVRNPIANELENWDPIRGQWLAESLEAMSENRPIPDRMFPEDLTPHQMISLLPDNLRTKLAHLSRTIDLNNFEEEERWESIGAIIEPVNSNCGTLSARTYGDPHLVTFDGSRYSFQTVGEFVLTRSTSGMEIQTRQKPEKEDFSLNTAIAMRVGGDRVGIYASDYPDANNSTPIRVNGRPVTIQSGGKYFLSNGGIIRQNGIRDYTVDWPSGESVAVEIKTSSGMHFMNVNINVSGCGQYDGLLGNANGNQSDDFGGLNDQASIGIPQGSGIFTGSSREIEQSRLAYIANAMGDKYRITPSTSLFDYAPGKSTYTFTDRSFPRVHRTLDEIPEDQMAEARRLCRAAAIKNKDLNGCIYDQVYLEIEPACEPAIRNPTVGIVLTPIVRTIANVNPKPPRPIASVKPTENLGNTPVPNDPSTRPFEAEEITDLEINRTEIRNNLTANSLTDKREEAERNAHKVEERKRLEQKAEAAKAAERNDRERLEREEEREQLEERDRYESEQRKRYERDQQEAEERAENERQVQAREEERRATVKREEEAKEREERAERAEQEEREERAEREAVKRKEEAEREAIKKAEQRAKADAERKRQDDARKRKEAEAKKAKEAAERKAKEVADKKAKENALRKRP